MGKAPRSVIERQIGIIGTIVGGVLCLLGAVDWFLGGQQRSLVAAGLFLLVVFGRRFLVRNATNR